MAEYYQQGMRPMMVSTPLEPDKLLLVGFQGAEEISGLFSFKLDLIAPVGSRIAFDRLLGEPMTVAIRVLDGKGGGGTPKLRYFSGICRTFSQGNSDEAFTSYEAEIVPQFWLATRRAQSRIFQQMSVPEILKKVLAGFDVDYQTDGNFEKREYSVQYRGCHIQISIIPCRGWHPLRIRPDRKVRPARRLELSKVRFVDSLARRSFGNHGPLSSVQWSCAP